LKEQNDRRQKFETPTRRIPRASRRVSGPGISAYLQRPASSFQPLGFYSTHPGGSIPPNPMKTLTEKISSRHTHGRAPIHVAHPAGRDEAFGCLRHSQTQGEEKGKGEEKALARRSLLAEAANRNRAELKNP